MAVISEHVRIERPAAVIWAALADFGSISRWAAPVEHSCLVTDQQEGIGTERRVQIGRNALIERVIEWESDQRLGYAIEGLPVVQSAMNSWTLDDSAGATTVTLTSTAEVGPRPPQQLVARVVGRILARASRELLAGLKAHLEQPAESTSGSAA